MPVLTLVFAAAVLAIAAIAFVRPYGVYWRAAAGAGVLLAALGALWAMSAPPLGAGVGPFIIWIVFAAGGLCVAAASAAAATLRHVLNAIGERSLG